MRMVPQLAWMALAERYCARQLQTFEGLQRVLSDQLDKFKCEGWMLLECQMMDSSSMGYLTLLPYGPNNTYKTVPDHPISPHGLAPDMSIVEGILLASELPREPFRTWTAAAQDYLNTLGQAEYNEKTQRLRVTVKKRYKHYPSDYHRELVKLLGESNEEGFKVLKAEQGYASALGF